MAERVVLQGWFGMDNFGDDLLLEVTLAHLREAVPGIRIDVIGEGRRRPAFLPADVGYLPRASRVWRWRRNRWLRAGCDWVLCGGSVLDIDVLPRFIEPAEMVKSSGGRVFLHAVGLKADMEPTPELQTLMKLVDGCSVREQFGWQLLSRIAPAELVADPVFAMSLPSKAERSGRLLVALRGTEQAETELDGFAEKLMAVASREFTHIDILVCFPLQDAGVSRHLARRLSGLNVRLIDHLPAGEQAGIVAAADRVITMRLHPAIVSLAAGKVPWMLAPEHKHEALMRDVGKPGYLFGWREIAAGLEKVSDDTIKAAPLRAQGRRALELLSGWIASD